MPAIEVWSERGRDAVVTLDAPTYTIGSDPSSASIVLDDPTVSAVHALLERVGTVWLVRDVGSRNGTRLGHDRLASQRRLRDRDELHLGRTRLVFRDAAERPPTVPIDSPPDNLTGGEHKVLVELCRPLIELNPFQEPASVREIAERRFVGKNAVQAHLSNLYDKFKLYPGEGVNRRILLANEAIRRGAVTMGDLEALDAELRDPDGRRDGG